MERQTQEGRRHPRGESAPEVRGVEQARAVDLRRMGAFPRDSSWGSVYATAGAIVVVAAAWALLADVCATRARRAAATAALAVAFAAMFLLSDYVGVTQFNQPPRFCYQKEYMADSAGRERMVWRTPLYSVVSDDPSNQSAPLWIQAS